MLIGQYIYDDNDLTIAINQARNDGSLTYSLLVEMNPDDYQNGTNLIDSLILDKTDLSTILYPDTLPVGL